MSIAPEQLADLPPELIVQAIQSDPLLASWWNLREDTAWNNFVPRPDRPEVFDQQHGFCYNRDPVSFLVGGNAAGCLGAEQMIYDPVAKLSRRVSEIAEPFYVHAVDRRGQVVIGIASKPKIYGRAGLYRVTLSNDQSMVVTLGHKILDHEGNYCEIRKLPTPHALARVLPESNFEAVSIPPKNFNPSWASKHPSINLPASKDTLRSPLFVVSVEYLRTDHYWDFTVLEHGNYILADCVQSNTTEAAAYKTALFLLQQQPPPRKNTPFWIISNSYDQVCDTCWGEKLLGHGHIPSCEVDWDNISWFNLKAERPSAVPLLPWPGRPGKNWTIQFKSYEQGRRALQARSIGGFWFSEQFPLDLFLETLRGCREYMFPGGQFAEFTPVEPDLCLWVESVMDDPPPGWKFYRANTECNKANLAEGWYDQFFATVPDEMLETRKTGALATFEGVIYQSFNPAVHVLPCIARTPSDIPAGVFHFRGVDWGASSEHPFVCVWGYRDGVGDWYIYDEYWSPDQSKITMDHVEEVKNRWPWPKNPHYGPTFADPSRPGEINEFNIRGIHTQPAANAVYKGIDCIRSLLKIQQASQQPKLFFCKQRCPHTIEEMRKYRWLRGKRPNSGGYLNPKVAAPVPLKRDDDCPDAVRYMIYSEQRGRGAVPGSAKHGEDSSQRRAVQLVKDHNGAGRLVAGNRAGWFKRS